jgi:hypothetical protein
MIPERKFVYIDVQPDLYFVIIKTIRRDQEGRISTHDYHLISITFEGSSFSTRPIHLGTVPVPLGFDHSRLPISEEELD